MPVRNRSWVSVVDLDLRGKRALITGSSRGIGRAIAAAFAGEGARICMNGRDRTALDTAAASLGAAQSAGDLSEEETARRVVTEAIRALGGLDLLVCNVGNGTSVPPGEEDEAEMTRMLRLNLGSAANAVRAARPHLATGQDAAVVCISSIAGHASIGAPTGYTAAKAALNSYVASMARPLASDGIRINAISPGNIHFEGGAWWRRQRDNPSGVAAMLETAVPLRRFGRTQEIADLACFLASPRAAFITGAVIVADGGQLVG